MFALAGTGEGVAAAGGAGDDDVPRMRCAVISKSTSASELSSESDADKVSNASTCDIARQGSAQGRACSTARQKMHGRPSDRLQYPRYQ